MCLRRSFAVLLIPLLLSCGGCNTVTFGYNHADWALRYWANSYTSFNDAQKEEIRSGIADYMRWHRQHALPEYTAFLQQVDATVARGTLETDDVMHARAELGRLYRLTMTPLVHPAAHVLSTLDNAQIEKLRETLVERNREQREEMLSGKERDDLAARAKRHIGVTENLVGPLSGDQRGQIKRMSLGIPFITGSYLDQREARQVHLIALLNDHAGEERIAALFRGWIDTPEPPSSPQQRQAIEDYDHAMDKMVVQIFGMLTTEQRHHLRGKIADYIDAFQRLHAAVEPEQASHRPQGGAPPTAPLPM